MERGINFNFILWKVLYIDFVLKEIPAARYRLETEPENEKAAALYSRLGFEFFEYVLGNSSPLKFILLGIHIHNNEYQHYN